MKKRFLYPLLAVVVLGIIGTTTVIVSTQKNLKITANTSETGDTKTLQENVEISVYIQFVGTTPAQRFQAFQELVNGTRALGQAREVLTCEEGYEEISLVGTPPTNANGITCDADTINTTRLCNATVPYTMICKLNEQTSSPPDSEDICDDPFNNKYSEKSDRFPYGEVEGKKDEFEEFLRSACEDRTDLQETYAPTNCIESPNEDFRCVDAGVNGEWDTLQRTPNSPQQDIQNLVKVKGRCKFIRICEPEPIESSDSASDPSDQDEETNTYPSTPIESPDDVEMEEENIDEEDMVGACCVRTDSDTISCDDDTQSHCEGRDDYVTWISDQRCGTSPCANIDFPGEENDENEMDEF